MSGQPQAPVALPPGKSPWYPLDRRLRGHQSRSGRRGEEKIFTPPELELRPLGRPAIPTKLSRFHIKKVAQQTFISVDGFPPSTIQLRYKRIGFT
jgi:hypothetical protein